MKRISPHICVFIIIALIALTGLNSQFHSKLTELRYSLLPEQATGNVVLVAIDSKSLQETETWPWPRSLHAEIIKKLEIAGASDIAFDIDFSSKSTEEQDAIFLQALKQAKGSIILPSFKQIQKHFNKAPTIVHTEPLPDFKKNSWLANVNLSPSRNGLVEKIPYGYKMNGEFIPSLASLLSGKLNLKTDGFYVDYSIKANTVPVVSYVDVIHNRISKDVFKNKKVIIGATATELGDSFIVPGQGIISGPMLQVLATETLLQNHAMHHASLTVSFAGVLILSLLFLVLSFRTKLANRLYLFIIAAVAIELFALALHKWSHLVVDTSLWHVTLLAYTIITLLSEIDFRTMLVKITSQKLENTEQMLAQVFNDSFTGTIITNEDGIIQIASDSAGEILRLQNIRKLEGLHYNNIFPTDMVTAADRLLTQKKTSDNSIHYSSHTDIHTKNGDNITLEYIVTLSTMKNEAEADKHGHIISFSFQDITARHKAEIAQREATTAAINANKAKTEFLTTMSHELRTPLNSILGFSEIIQNQSLGPDSMDQYAEFASDIQSSGRQLLSVVNNILEVTRMESGSVQLNEEKCDIIDMIEYAIEDTSYQFKNQSLNIVIEANKNIPGLLADPLLCQKTLTEIISNAIKFSKPYDEIVISARETENGRIIISVKDQGEGISKHEIDNIFKPFYQIDSSKDRHFEGTGIGLTTASAYMKLHGGNIKVESQLGEGTTIHLNFPSDRTIENPGSIYNINQSKPNDRKIA